MKEELQQKALEITGLVVNRGRDFSLRIPELEVFPGRVACIVGANGCGKTTLLETITGLLSPVSGVVTIAGRPLTTAAQHPYIKRVIGFVPDDEGWIIPELTADEYILLLAQIFARAGVTHDLVREARILARALQFTQAGQQLGSLSHGNKKKVQIIAALMHRPSLVIVDELRNGLDPIAIRQAEELLAKRKQSGTAIMAATHDLWWAERFADDIIMVQNGRILLQETTTSIVANSGSVEAKFMELYKP